MWKKVIDDRSNHITSISFHGDTMTARDENTGEKVHASLSLVIDPSKSDEILDPGKYIRSLTGEELIRLRNEVRNQPGITEEEADELFKVGKNKETSYEESLAGQ
jgi:hypothetical protein